MHDSQNPIKMAYTIDKPKVNYSARQEIKTQLLFKTMKAYVCSKYKLAL